MCCLLWLFRNCCLMGSYLSEERGTGKWKIGTKPNLNPCPFSNFIFNFLLCSHFPNSLFPVPCSPFPVPKGLSTSLSHGERLSPCRGLQVDCWRSWTPPWGLQPCIEREYLSHKWRMRAGDNRKSSNTVEPCVKQTPFVKRTDGLVCFKRFFLHFLLNDPLCSEHQWLPQASLRSKCRNGRKGKREGD